MWSLIVICAIVSVSAVHSETFRKCCPNSQSLVKVIDFDDEKIEQYKCLDSVFTKTSNEDSSSSTISASDSLDVEYGLPKDCDLQMIQFDKNVIQLSVEDNHCYDRLVSEVVNGTVKQIIAKTVGLVCNGTVIAGGRDEKIQNVKKCCPPGQMYDTEYHQCRNMGDGGGLTYNHQWLLNQLRPYGSEVFEFENGLSCKSEEYDVQLKDDMFSITLQGSALNVVSHTENNTTLIYSAGNWCVDREYSTRRLMARVCTQECPSFGAFCLKKCCPIGQHFRPLECGSARSVCAPSDDETLFDMSEYINPIKEEYGIGDILGIHVGIYCQFGKAILNRSSATDAHHLTRDGRLHSNLGTDYSYCLELFDWRHCDRPTDYTAAICYKGVPQPKDFKLSFVLISISCVCLALTLLVYCSIPELRNLHGRNLICHVSTMLLAFVCLARVQYQYVADKNVCAALGYGIYFGFVAAFVWLNVMCFDIWWTFGSVRTVQPLHKGRATRRRFLWYSLYAWGVTVTITLAMYLLDKYPLTRVLDSNMGENMCWFGTIQNSEEDWPHYIFFVIPMGLVTSVNFVLWLLTARHCARVKSEVHRLQAGSVGDRVKRRFRVDKANFVLTGKLWVVMGAGWGTELLSTVLDPTSLGWFLSIIDIINELQGVFIFVILVFKPKLYYLIRKKLGFSRTSKDPRLEKPDAQKNGTSSTARTSSTFLSRTVSSDERTNCRVSLPNDNPKPS